MVASQTPLAVACSFWKSRSILVAEQFDEPKLNIQFEFVMIIFWELKPTITPDLIELVEMILAKVQHLIQL